MTSSFGENLDKHENFRKNYLFLKLPISVDDIFKKIKIRLKLDCCKQAFIAMIAIHGDF